MYPEPIGEKDELAKIPIPQGLVLDREVNERMTRLGVDALSNRELLGVLLKSPDPAVSSAEFAQLVLDRVDGTLQGLKRLTVEDLQGLRGYGYTKARMVIAALEIGRRRLAGVPHERHTVTSSAQAYTMLLPLLQDKLHEEFWVLLLDRGHRVIRTEKISSGGMHGTVADPKLIFERALRMQASAMILAHNHPSGQLRPSEEDIRLTKKLVEGGRLLDIQVNDHVIIGDLGYYSFADNGMLH